MVEQASSFFDAASSARGLDVDRGLLLETRPADLHSSSSPEVASQGSFRSTRQRGTFETLSLRAAWGPFVLFAVVRKDSPLHTAIDALQPEPQSGPGSSIDDQMLGY